MLFTEEIFEALSTDAKVLYGLLLDRISLSRENGWMDDVGRVYVYYTIKSVKKSMRCANTKACGLLRELDEFGLIERKKQGLGKPTIIYVKDFTRFRKAELLDSEKQNSVILHTGTLDNRKSETNKTEKNNTESNKTIAEQPHKLKPLQIATKDKIIPLEIGHSKLMFMESKNQYKVETGHATYNESAMMEMKKAEYADKEMTVEAEVVEKSDFEIANYIMYHTMLPRLAIFKIIAGIDKRELLNNQDILDEVTQLILKKLNDTKAANITSYEVINGYELDSRNIFELDTISEEDFDKEWRVFQANSDRKAAMNEYYKMDSVGEYEFAKKLENNENVLMFTKLKKGGFIIDTPYGNYSPDWAIVCKKEGLKNPDLGIYFVVETKAGKAEANLQDVERNKIKCGKLHFAAVSNQIKFDWVNSYYDFIEKFGVNDSEEVFIETTRNHDNSDVIKAYANHFSEEMK